jgi:hypothetical protein
LASLPKHALENISSVPATVKTSLSVEDQALAALIPVQRKTKHPVVPQKKRRLAAMFIHGRRIAIARPVIHGIPSEIEIIRHDLIITSVIGPPSCSAGWDPLHNRSEQKPGAET